MAVLAVLAALGSALLVAVASVLQHRAGRGNDAPLRRVFRHPLWIVGSVAGIAGFGLHVVALSIGALSLVQPLLVSGLLFALPLGLALDHRAIRFIDVGAAAAVVGGLAIFQLTARPSEGRSVANLSVLGWCTAAAVTIVALGLLFAARHPRNRAAWLGLYAGATYGVVAALLKASVGLFASQGSAALSFWPPYAFAVLVSVAIAINQLAFNAGPLAQSLPLITIVDPMISVVIGSLAFNETLSTGAGSVTGQLLGFAVMSTGVVLLARRANPSGSGWSAEHSAAGASPASLPGNVQAPGRVITTVCGRTEP